MMDFHILIVICCVFLASLFSWLILNKFLRRKTFEEIIAEKKALTDKLNAQTKAITKKPKKLQNLKKEQKREKKQRQREEKQRDATEHDDSEDTQSEKPSVEDETPGLSKIHVEFEPDPEIVTLDVEVPQRRQSNSEKDSSKQKSKKDKKSIAKPTSSGGILINKNEPVVVKVNSNVEETLNHFETKPPKDVVELKKADKERKEEKAVVVQAQPPVQAQIQTQLQQNQNQSQNQSKKEKHGNKKEKAVNSVVEQLTDVPQQQTVNKEIKQTEEKVRQASPKIQQNGPSNSGKSSKQQQKKHGNKENSNSKEIMHALDKLSDTDTVSVNFLMNLFRRAELNRSEIQILIDYLLNKQQDTPATHSEWSDDILQKLKRQLEEKERLLIEQQEASAGIQAKLRELRTEINTERLQMTSTVKAYTEKIQSKDQEINGLNQELQSVNEKLNNERQQFQAKLLHEKQASSQDLLTQLQLMQNDIAHKDKCINELTCLVNASRQAVEESQQKNEIIQSQAQQLHALEQQRDELEQVSSNRIFELEKLKELEAENAEIKVELLNLQNALESSKIELAQGRKDLDAVNSELALARNVELSEKQQQIQTLQAQNNELSQQLASLTIKKDEQYNKEQTGMQATLDALRIELAEKEKRLTEFVTKNTELLQQHTNTAQNYGKQHQELQQRIETLSTDVATKHKQLQEVERIHTEKYTNREKELLQQLQEQKEKNNDLRMKNWKLVEALQNAETTTTLKENKTLSKQNASLVQTQQQFQTANSNSNYETHLRDLLQRTFPEAVKSCAGSALSLPIDQWIEQVLATHIKQQSVTNASSGVSSINKSTQSNSNDTTSHTNNNNSNSNHNSSHNSHNNNNNNNNNNTNKNNTLISESSTAATQTTSTNNSNSSRTTNKGDENSSIDIAEHQKLLAENAQLRVQNSELTRLVTKTSNTLSELEGQAREQDDNWRSIVRLKDEKIHALQHSNGEQDI